MRNWGLRTRLELRPPERDGSLYEALATFREGEGVEELGTAMPFLHHLCQCLTSFLARCLIKQSLE